MSILAASLGDLARRAETLGDPTFRADLERARVLAGGLDPYLAACTTPESPALAALAARTKAQRWDDGLQAEMLSGHVEGQVLGFLVRLTGARRVLEVGMFTGYSALAMAEALPEDGVVVACEQDPRAITVAREGFAASAAGARIDVREGPAAATLAALADEGRTFDLVFVDADKTGYLGYVHTLIDRGLLATDGVICVDNTLMAGQPWADGEPSVNGAAIAAFNAAIAADARLEQVVLAVRDGLTLIRRV